MTLQADVETFCRQVRARSEAHRRAVQLLSGASLSGQVVAVLRQELDSMVRLIFLLAQSDEDYRHNIGTSLRDRVLCVVHVQRDERDRIISARRATAGERQAYEVKGTT